MVVAVVVLGLLAMWAALAIPPMEESVMAIIVAC